MKFRSYPAEKFLINGWLINGVLLGIGWSLVFYGFLYLVRETFRVQIPVFNIWSDPIILNGADRFIYNYILALTATVVGWYTGFRFTLENSTGFRSSGLRRKLRSLHNLLQFNYWIFLYIIGKFLLFSGMFYLTFYLQYELTSKDLMLPLLFLPIGIFLAVWPGIMKVMGKRGLKWLLVNLLTVLLFSLGLAQWELIDYKAIDESALQADVFHKYNLQLPVTKGDEYVNRFRFSPVPLYLVQNADGKGVHVRGSLSVIGRYYTDSISKSELADFVAYHNQSNPSGNENFVLFADKDILYKDIRDLKYSLRKAGVRILFLQTSVEEGWHTIANNYFSKWAMHSPMLYHFPEFEAFLDSAEMVDPRRQMLVLPTETSLYRTERLRNYNRVVVDLSPGQVKVNGTVVDRSTLQRVVYALVTKHPENYYIDLRVTDAVRYGEYIATMDVMRQEIIRIRESLSRELRQRKADEQLSWMDRIHTKNVVRYRVPEMIIEWTREEQRLLRLKEKIRIKEVGG